MSKLKGAQILVQGLEREGVEVVFGIPGGANLPTFDALYQSKQIKVVLTAHEQGASNRQKTTPRGFDTGVCLCCPSVAGHR